GRALDTLVSRATTPQTGAAAGADVAERLRSLGYVSGRVEIGAGRPGGAGRTGGAGNEAGQGDPKRGVARYEAYVTAVDQSLAALEGGRAHDAEIGFRSLARDFPRAFEPHQYLARALAARHATGAAVAELDLAIQLSPREAVLRFD